MYGLVTDMKYVWVLEMRLVAPMPEQIGIPTTLYLRGPETHTPVGVLKKLCCAGGNLFRHGCNKFHFYGLYIFQLIDYKDVLQR